MEDRLGYRSILTVATRPDAVAPVIATASAFAQREDAHLEVLALGLDRSQLGYYALSGSDAMIHISQDEAEEDARRISAAARAALEAEDPALRWTVEGGVAQMGSLPTLISARARFADLVIMPRPYGETLGPVDEAAVEAAMFEGQAPILVLPDTPIDGATVGRRIAVAWNQSREALVAIRRALPLLIAASKVDIVIVDPPTHGPEKTDPGGMLSQMLARHGVRVEVSVLAKTMPKVSEVLSRHVTETGADLLVMGAYGHSRFRQAILGGATRSMLEQAAFPVLMAH